MSRCVLARPVRVAVCVLVGVVVVSAPGAPLRAQDTDDSGAGGSAAQGSGGWIPPVPGAVARPFVAPIAEYAAGHRGLDLVAASGSPVRAAHDGVVSFAGAVAGSLHVVLTHEGGIRTSYSFLASVEVPVGATVRRGQVIGRAGGAGEGHAPGILHFGVRVGERYVDPMLLFRPRDLTAMVHLVPADERAAAEEPNPSAERRALANVEEAPSGDDCAGVIGDVASLVGLGGGAEAACEALEEVIDAGWQGLRALGAEVAQLVDRLEPVVAAVIERMRTLGERLSVAAAAVAGEVARAVTEVIDRVVEFAEQLYVRLTSCPQPPPKAHPRGSGNLVVAVAGLGSSVRLRRNGTLTPSFHLDAAVLGYRRTDVSYFSYRAESATYGALDTTGDLHEKARLLGRHLQQLAATHPGRRIDLVAHSQGGVVVDLFLAEVYRGHEDEYPTVANVVTFASPHEGTPLAALADAVHRQPMLDLAARTLADAPLEATALHQLREGSPTIRGIPREGFPRRVRFLSIAGSEDAAVPSSSADPPVGSKTVVQVGAPLSTDDHTGILRDADALSAAQAHLSGGHPVDSCGLLVDVQGQVESVAVRGATSVVEAMGAVPSDALEEVAR